MIEAAIRFGVPRVVNVSSETVPGFFFPERDVAARLRAGRRGAPDPPAGPLRDRQALRRAADGRRDAPLGPPLPVDPPVLGAVGGQLRAQPRPALRDPESTRRARACGPTSTSTTSPTRWGSPPSRTSTRHEVFYIASPDNHANRPLADLIRHHHGDAIEIREPLPRPDASGLSIAKAQRLLGYAPSRSWRDYLTEDGELLEAARERLERGDTGIQRGRALG